MKTEKRREQWNREGGKHKRRGKKYE